MAFLYLTEQGACLRKTGDRLIIEKERQELLEVECHHIETVLVFGNVQITTQALSELLEHGIELALLTQTGKLKGQLTPIKPKNIELRMAQYRKYNEPEFALQMAKVIINAKIRNSLATVRRFSYNHRDMDLRGELQELERALTLLKDQRRVDAVMGIEGVAAKNYFGAFGKMCLGELKFCGRKKRPAPDPVNALLSFGYTLVANEILSLLDAMGFDPYIGFLHRIEYGRPSLAVDLVEEFRSVIVDRLTLNLINKNVLRQGHFHLDEESGSMCLNREYMKEYFRHYEDWINSEFTHPRLNIKTTFRKSFRYQAESAARAITENRLYEPFIL